MPDAVPGSVSLRRFWSQHLHALSNAQPLLALTMTTPHRASMRYQAVVNSIAQLQLRVSDSTADALTRDTYGALACE
eukprot:6184170-Pleurochrysis_carterae.AAC.1